MPRLLHPGNEFSFSLFSQQIRFLKNAVSGFVRPQDLGPNVRPMSIQPERQLSSLAAYHGASLFLNLSSVEGGRYHGEVSQLRSWADGNRIPFADFSHALDRFERALTDPNDLERELRKSAPSRSPFHLPSALLDFLVAGCEIDHGGKVFFANSVPIDPLLDPSPMPEVFSYLEEETKAGCRLTVPFLDTIVCGPPGLSFGDLSELYLILARPDYSCYFMERILYVVPRNERHARWLPMIRKALEADLISEACFLKFAPQAVSHKGRIIGEIPWNDPQAFGDLDLSSIAPSVHRRWVEQKEIPEISFSELPILQAWLLRYRDSLHWSDVKRLNQEKELGWIYAYQGEMSSGQKEAMEERVQGILGEIHHRREMLEEYSHQKEKNPELVFLLEGEIKIPDGKMTSDGLIGRLNVAERVLEMTTLYEITTTESLEEKSREQHGANLEYRFPQKGISIFDAGGIWGRVSVKAGTASTKVILSQESERKELKETAREVVREILALASLRKSLGGMIPIEERRRYAGVRGKTGAGLLLSSVLGQLWKESPDLRWLDLQISSRIPRFPMVGRSLLIAYQVALRNVSADLSPSGKRRSATSLAGRHGVSPATVRHYQEAIQNELNDRGFSFLSDPGKEGAKINAAGRAFGKILPSLWEGKRTAQEVEAALRVSIGRETDETIKVYMEAYLACLRNVSKDLNASGTRAIIGSIADQEGVTPNTVSDYQEAVKNELTARGFPFLPDPCEKKAKAIGAGKSLNRMLPKFWKGKKTAQEVAQALEREMAGTDDEGLKSQLELYLACLRNVSGDLNPRNERTLVKTLDPRWKGMYTAIGQYQKAIERELKKRELAVLPKRKWEKAFAASQSLKKNLPRVWAGKTSAEEVAQALEEEIPKSDEEAQAGIRTYLSCLRNVSKDLNPSGKREGVVSIGKRFGVGWYVISNYQEAIERELKDREIPVIPDPKLKTADEHFAARVLKKALPPLWEKAKAAQEVDQALQDEIHQAEDGRVKRRLRAYQALLRNVSKDLNGSGERANVASLAELWELGRATVKAYQKSIEKELGGKNLSFLPDPGEEMGKTIGAGHSLKNIIPSLWDGKNAAAEVAKAIEGAISKAGDEGLKRHLRIYWDCLKNVSRDLNDTGGRMTMASLVSRWKVTQITIRKHQRNIQEKLKEKGWPVIGNEA